MKPSPKGTPSIVRQKAPARPAEPQIGKGFAKLLVDLRGVPLKLEGRSLTVGGGIAHALVLTRTNDPLRSYALATKINEADVSGKEIEITTSDKEFIVNTLKSYEGYTDLVTGQIIEFLMGIQ